MSFQLTDKDRQLLKGVHADLVRVIERAAAITTIPFKITEGLRTLERQKQLKAQGLSTTLNSRHLTGHAVDLVPMVDANHDGKVSREELYAWPAYYALAKIIKQAAIMENVPVEWGGDWRKFKDGPHWQLPRKQYPTPHAQSFAAMGEPPTEYETEDAAASWDASVTMGLGTTAAAGSGLPALIGALTGQQMELTSGDWTRIAIALGIIGLTAYAVWRQKRSR